jgi:adenylate cyclase
MSSLSKAGLFGLLIGIVGITISFFPLAHKFEEDADLELLFNSRGIRKAPSDVVVVSIDRDSSDQLNVSDNPDRWPRSLHARLVETLAGEGARVVIFDVYFREPRSPAEDNSLAEAIGKARNVVLAEFYRAREIPATENGGPYADEHRIVKVLKPIPSLSQSAFATAPFVLPRLPVKVNQYWTFQADAGDSPTHPIVAFQLYTLPLYDEFLRLVEKVSPEQAGKLPRDAVRAIQSQGAAKFMRDIRGVFEGDPQLADKMLRQLQSNARPPDNRKNKLLMSLIKLYGGANRRYLNYYGPPRTVSTVPFYRALQPHQGPGRDTQVDFKGKAVFVGLSEILLSEKADSFHTVFSQANGVFVSGVEIAATAFSNLLEDNPITPIDSGRYILILLAWGILIGIICRTASTGVAAISLVVLGTLYFTAAAHKFSAQSAWYPIAIPLFLQTPVAFFSALFWNYFETNKERQNIRKAFSLYVPDEVVDQLARNIVDMKRSGQTEYGICLFADIAGYTNLSETMEPQELSDFMHKYFEATFAPIRQNGGRIVSLEGDSILALWKGVRPNPVLGKQACLAALGIAKAVRQFSHSLKTIDLSTRISVHAGQIYLGNVGAGDHYKYGPTGDTVNTASRMDGLNKYLGTRILVSEEVLHEVDGFLTREAGRFKLKGKTHAVGVHELMCNLKECEETQKKGCGIFADALGAFKRRSWDEAEYDFRRCIETLGKDELSSFYLALCATYKKNSPEEPWDGVIPMEEK